jgi:hypothetical protein
MIDVQADQAAQDSAAPAVSEPGESPSVASNAGATATDAQSSPAAASAPTTSVASLADQISALIAGLEGSGDSNIGRIAADVKRLAADIKAAL